MLGGIVRRWRLGDYKSFLLRSRTPSLNGSLYSPYNSLSRKVDISVVAAQDSSCESTKTTNILKTSAASIHTAIWRRHPHTVTSSDRSTRMTSHQLLHTSIDLLVS
uniref:Uncharacterized protein n=1 Tax=Timema tahoe TaxID=61484 RepID=A0A7R9IHW0_9NEOP|nr:unnamed protein product [Timema tahoe]